MTGEMSTPAKSGNNFLIGLNNGSVILYKKLPTIFTKVLCVLTIPNAISQLRMAWMIKSQINSSTIWLISITREFILK